MSTPELRTVVLRQYPVRLGVAAKQHNDELLREFTIIAAGRADGTAQDELPSRLVAVMDVIRRQYGAGLEERDARLFAALSAGVEEIDVEQRLPAAAAGAAQALGAILAETDDFCRQGRHLLTLETPPDVLQYRHWYLSEVVTQLEGGPATPWPVFRAHAAEPVRAE